MHPSIRIESVNLHSSHDENQQNLDSIDYNYNLKITHDSNKVVEEL